MSSDFILKDDILWYIKRFWWKASILKSRKKKFKIFTESFLLIFEFINLMKTADFKIISLPSSTLSASFIIYNVICFCNQFQRQNRNRLFILMACNVPITSQKLKHIMLLKIRSDINFITFLKLLWSIK